MAFNPNELVLEKIRAVEEYDPATMELSGRYTQIEDPSLKTSADGTQVTDAMGAEIVTFYNAQQGTFSFTNSLHSLDLMASQFGSKKEIADADNKIVIPVSEVITIANNIATLKYAPVGDGKFTIDASNKTLTFPEGTEGRVFVQYERESEAAVKVTKKTDGVPEIKTLLIHAIFHEPCNTNIVYSGVIFVPRAQINPESVEVNLTSDGKHSAEYRLQKPYCDDNAKLFDIIVSED